MGVRAFAVIALAALSSVQATLVLDGRLYKSSFPDSSVFNSNTVYQTYIHGNQKSMSDYITLSTNYKNPADSKEEQGMAVQVDQTSSWLDSQTTFRRTEVIPAQPDLASQSSGSVWFYHVSFHADSQYPWSTTKEHQFFFHERDSDYTQNFGMRYGSDAGSNIQFYTEDNSGNRVTQYTFAWNPSTWYNLVFKIDFGSKVVTLYQSTGSDPVKQVASATVPRLGAGWWHMGQLRFVDANPSAFTERIWLSSVQVTKDTMDSWLSGSATTTTRATTTTTTTTTRPPTTTTTTTRPITSATCAGGVTTVTIPNQTTVTLQNTVTVTVSGQQQQPTTTTTTRTTTTSQAQQTNCAAKYGQCGGQGYTGPTCCQSGSTCKSSNQYYSQCL
ncbi:hypothetical protein HDV00_010112 [Rhizophlyctis rosea]|nr:hypothetical protein HDV00_010112 [Rhizophlyctis rosea]